MTALPATLLSSAAAWLLLCSPLAFAAASGSAALKNSFGLDLGLTSTAYPDVLPPPLNHDDTVLQARGTFSSSYQRAAKIKISPSLRWDPQNTTPSERFFADLPEAFAQVQYRALTLQAGFNTFNWGVTDGYNPLDVVSPRDYRDPLRTEKLGVPAFSGHLDLGETTSIEAIYIPRQRQAILPGEKSRWLPRSVIRNRSFDTDSGAVELRLPSVLDYSYQSAQVLDQAQNNNYGGRLQASPLGGLDLSVVYFEGLAPTPTIDLSISGKVTALLPKLIVAADPAIGLIPVYYRQRMAGGSAVYAWNDFIFRFETAITRPISKRGELPGRSEEQVLGIERSFPIGEQTLTLLAQGTYANHEESVDNSATSLSRVFDRAAILGARFPFASDWTASGSLLHDLRYGQNLAHLEVQYRITDALKANLTGDVLTGDPGTPVGSYSANDRVSAGLLYRL